VPSRRLNTSLLRVRGKKLVKRRNKSAKYEEKVRKREGALKAAPAMPAANTLDPIIDKNQKNMLS